MPSRLVALCLDAADPRSLASYWAALLGRDQRQDGDGVLLPGDETQVSLRFVPSRAAKLGPNRVHLHLTSASQKDQERIVAAALRLGATHLDVGQRPEEGHVVLADPEGNELCVIEPGNNFLAGCGLLGELACEGTRTAGRFWREVLNWPLVWEQDQETAIQSPAGGTKIAWGGPPVPPLTGGRRQRFLLEPLNQDQRTEVDRLVALGATRLEPTAHGPAALADPDGNEFIVLLAEQGEPEAAQLTSPSSAARISARGRRKG